MTRTMEQNQLWKLMTERIHLNTTTPLPETYGCNCEYCELYKGMLIRPNGSYYNRNDRRKYYIYRHGAGGAGHINPTPLHVARWAIQTLTIPGDWVFDPFLGSGTTAVEALNHQCKFVGIELDTYELAYENIKLTFPLRKKYIPDQQDQLFILEGDARKEIYNVDQPIKLTILHPPYSGDEQSNAKYDRSKEANMAFMKENVQYWQDMDTLIHEIFDRTVHSGFAVLGVKEMMRNKSWWDLHIKFCNILAFYFQYRGMVLLPHYPRTLHMNTYFQRWGVHPSYWQQIYVFKKVD